MKYCFLVLVYNVEKYLGRCLTSLINQTNISEYEIVLYENVSIGLDKTICNDKNKFYY